MNFEQNFFRPLKRIFWKISAINAEKTYPINESLIYFGVTGTDGKTTTSNFIYEIAKAHGYNPLLITTIGAKFQDKDIKLDIKSTSFTAYSIKTAFSSLVKLNFGKFVRNLLFSDFNGFAKEAELHRTTPLASEIRKTILEYEKKGADFFILESTSHSLDQYRVFGIKFDSVAFTNITNEHLDYHGTWENYASAKAKIITMLKDGGSVAINKSDEKSYAFLKQFISTLNKKVNVIEYSVPKLNAIKDSEFEIVINKSDEKQSVVANSIKFDSNLKVKLNISGNYNIFNALAAFCAFYTFNDSNPELICTGLSSLKSVKGRMEYVSHNPDIIVDYAHTPNAMRRALESVHQTRKSGGKTWVIFGCTGLRDKYKRPEMGKIAFELADNVMITADDVRTESLFDINNQIISGFRDEDSDFTIYSFYPELEYKPEENKFIVRFDEPNPNSRKNAIKFAIKNASPKDTIILLGIGHQNSILIGETDYEWSDINYVQVVLGELKRPAMKLTVE